MHDQSRESVDRDASTRRSIPVETLTCTGGLAEIGLGPGVADEDVLPPSDLSSALLVAAGLGDDCCNLANRFNRICSESCTCVSLHS